AAKPSCSAASKVCRAARSPPHGHHRTGRVRASHQRRARAGERDLWRRSQETVMSDASSIEWKAADWLQRRQFWNWSADDQAQLDVWLAESSAHRVAFLRLKSGYAQTERLVALRSIKPEPESRLRARWFQAIAALIAISAIGAGGALYFKKSEGVTYATPVGGRQTLTLADGTRIELNTDTVLKLNR